MVDFYNTILFFASLFVGFFTQILVFAILIRRQLIRRRVKAHALSAFSGLVAFLLIHLMVQNTNMALYVLPAAMIILVCFSYIFFHLDNMGETARRIRLLWELHGHSEGLTREELLEKYPPREVFQRRIRRLLTAGQCYKKSEWLVWSGGSFSIINKIMQGWSLALFGPGGPKNSP